MSEPHETGCYGCGKPVGPPDARGWHPACYQRQRNVEQTGDPARRVVWRVSRHQRRRMTNVSRSRAGR